MAERVNTGSLDLRGAVSSTAGARSGCGIQEECSTVHQDTVSSSSMKQSAGLGHGSSSASRNRKGFSAEQRCLNSISKCDGCEVSDDQFFIRNKTLSFLKTCFMPNFTICDYFSDPSVWPKKLRCIDSRIELLDARLCSRQQAVGRR